MILGIFRKSVSIIPFLLKSDKYEDLRTSRAVLIRIGNVSDKTVEKIKTHVL